MRSAPPSSLHLTLSQILLRFSLKESVYKAIFPYVKKYIPFQEVEVYPTASGTASVVLSHSLLTQVPEVSLEGHYRLQHDPGQSLTYCLTSIVSTEK
jgi:4'-phosphopantetheinyl transferase EntD